MGNVIQTNVSSIGAQRSLGKTNEALSTTFQRLSTGLRINSAKDDAAGLQISNQLTSQINGLGVAVRNANDGISLAQTAEGALQETTNILQRIRDLSLQSSNASNSVSEREALQAEVSQLQSEVDRIANTTRFGSRGVLNGSFSNQAFQVGAFAAETISFSIASSRGEDLGRINTLSFGGFATAGASATAATPASLIDENQTLTFAIDGKSTDISVSANESVRSIQDKINSTVGKVTADAKTTARVTFANFDNAGDTATFTVNGIQLTSVTGNTTDTATATAVKAAIDADSRLSNLTVTDNADGTLDIVDETGADVVFNDVTQVQGGGVANTVQVQARNFANGAAIGNNVTVTSGEGSLVTGDISFTTTASTSGSLLSSSGTGGVTTSTTAAAGVGTITDTGNRVSTIDISTFAGAQSAIDVVDAALTTIDSQRGDLGAIQNRLSSTISNLGSIIENVSAARSRIRDTDFAVETANLAKNQVLQQAGLSILAQANASSQSVLSLLQ